MKENKDYRIAKCLTDDGIKEFAIFTDGSRKSLIYEDEEGRKYFHVDNKLNTTGPNFLRRSFTGRIKDAVETIRNDDGDCVMMQTGIFGFKFVKVVRFVDREIGEQLRQKTLKGWVDTKFTWGIECGNKNSFSGYAMINRNGERVSPFETDEEKKVPMQFDSESDAQQYMDDTLEKAKKYAAELIENIIPCNGDNDKTLEVFDNFSKKMSEECNTPFPVIEDLMLDMLDTELSSFKNEDKSLDQWGYKIIQCVA